MGIQIGDNELKIGDIVRFKNQKNKIVVVKIRDNIFSGISTDGLLCSADGNISGWTIIEHADEVEQLIDKLKSEEE